MKRKGLWLVILGAAFLAAAPRLRPADHYKVVDKPGNFYYGHIGYIEPTAEGKDPVVVREGRLEPEPAVLNFPIGPGDAVRTSSDRRCEIQFDSGTIVRLDFNTEVKVETILARGLSNAKDFSNLVVSSGRVYIMYKQYDRREIFQVLTPNAAVKLRHNAVGIIAAAADGSTDVQVRFGRAHVLFGEDENLLEDQEVGKLERFIVQKDHQTQKSSYVSDTDFDLWNQDVNARFTELHEGLTALPKPIQKLPPAVFYFAQKFGNQYGEWLWDDYAGYVWRPFIDNMMYPWGWRPYYYGHWAYSGGQMFWIPQEPWGWVPYHLGIWQWNKKRGWYWLPGSMFAPAWVAWDFFFGYAAWRPWGLYDWIGGYGTAGFFYHDSVWDYMSPLPLEGIQKDQLKKFAEAPLPVPRELKSAVRAVKAAYLRRDPAIIESLKEVPRHLVLVPKESLSARDLPDRALSWDKVPKGRGIPPATSGPGAFRRFAEPGLEALRIFRGLEAPRDLPRRTGAPGSRSSEARTSVAVPRPEGRAVPVPLKREAASGGQEAGRAAMTPAVRFRDWNPDLRIAREMGVRIEYSSRRNEIVCPELKLSSRDRMEGSRSSPALGSRGMTDASGAAIIPGAPGTGAPPSEKRDSSRASSAQEKSSGKSGETEKIKK